MIDHPGGAMGGINDTMAAFAEPQARRDRAERQADRIIDMSLDPICIAGFDGCFKRVNPAFMDVDDGTLRIAVRDDGVGGVRPDGRGLVGLRDRLEALGGRLRIDGPNGRGTLVAAEIPLSGHPFAKGAPTAEAGERV